MRSELFVALLTLLTAAQTSTPPKFLEGNVPSDPIRARDGTVALYLLDLFPDGRVREIRDLETDERIDQSLGERLLSWRFEPGTNERDEAIPLTVLVAAVIRRPTMAGALPPLPSSPDVEEFPEEIPYPRRMARPSFPPQASFGGVALVEADIGKDGKVSEARVVRTSDAFDELSLDAMTGWSFRPARDRGEPVPSRVYVLFSFDPPMRTGWPRD